VTTGGHALYRGTIAHVRTHEVRHAFSYPVAMHLFDVDALAALNGSSRLVGYNRRRLVAVHDRDHFDGRPIAESVRVAVSEAGEAWPGGPVLMLTHPRILGYVFNPISVYYCHDPAGALRIVVAEVHNTFGERHVYVLGSRAAAGSLDRGAQRHTWHAKKAFHVSPFFTLDGTYRFDVSPPDTRLAFDVDLEVRGRRRLTARLRLGRVPFSDWAVVGQLLRYPLMTVQVIAAIHWQALRLWWKGVRYLAKPSYAPETARRTQP
jgi:uncharacterized protein